MLDTLSELVVASCNSLSWFCSQSVAVLLRLARVAVSTSARYYALVAGGQLGIAALAELYRDDSVCIHHVQNHGWVTIFLCKVHLQALYTRTSLGAYLASVDTHVATVVHASNCCNRPLLFAGTGVTVSEKFVLDLSQYQSVAYSCFVQVLTHDGATVRGREDIMSKLTSIVELHMAFGMRYRVQYTDFTPWNQVSCSARTDCVVTHSELALICTLHLHIALTKCCYVLLEEWRSSTLLVLACNM